ncbi:hypothetical protein GOARA_022_00050 [Gordonia araii NBRC 100433]|uniref:Mce-associated membrane protein n=1 Tax=Gordonia araii NBRC 100433 TaxID=1073574 RepID=G7GZA4_9ACTN|nr:hypothetical protein [Gordonia araii]NNG98641.1 hypothetical protein [Gordonia araii NBRC 100433]GAB08929.1 hypothetical protein GOARA_022_00050 [Gordonia araii NBRC 100433]
MSVQDRPSAAADRAAADDDRRRLRWLALGSVIAAAALVVAAWQFTGWRAEAGAQARHDAVRAQAPAVIADVFSYTPQTVAADSRRARTLVSDEFAAANAAALSDQRAGAAQWKTRTVAVGDSGDDWAEVIAVVVVTDPVDRESTDERILSTRFVHRGRWLLDAVELIR